MSTKSVELPNNIPTPLKAPGDLQLKKFRETLRQRWNEFDKATMQEAQTRVNEHPLGWFTDAQTERNKDADFIKAKATFDEAMTALWSIDSDEKLKQILETPGRLSSVINSLKDYLAKADNQKAYNNVLSHTFADLTGLRAQMTETAEDKKEADLAKASLPALATITWASLATEAASWLSDAVWEWVKDLGKEVADIKKNPMKKIAEFLGFTDSSIMGDFKSALSEKKAGWFKWFFASIKLWFYGFMAKFMGVDMAKHLTPEEMKLAGIKGKVEGWVKPETGKESEGREKIQDVTKNILYGWAFSGLISFHQGFLSGITGEKDPSKNKARIWAVYRYQSMYDLPYEKAQSLYATYKSNPDNPALLKELWVTDPKSSISPRDIFAALALIVDDKLMSTKTLQKNIGQNKNITVWALLTGSHGDWAIANDFEKIDPTLSVNPSQIFSQVFGNIGARFQVSKVWDSYKFGNSETQEQAQKIGAEGIVLTEITLTDIDINNIQDSEIDKQKLDPKSKELLRKLIAFWNVVKWPLAKDFSFGQESEYSQFYNTAKITPISLLKLYLVTWGDTNLLSMASPRKMGIYAIIRESFFDGPNKDKWAELFDKSIIKIATTWAMTPMDLDKYIPKDVQEAMGNISATITDTVIDSSWWVAHRAWLALPNGWKLGAWVGITLGIMLIWRLRILKYVGIWVGIWAVTAAGLFATAVYAWLSSEDKKKFPEEEIKKWAIWWLEKLLTKTE